MNYELWIFLLEQADSYLTSSDWPSLLSWPLNRVSWLAREASPSSLRVEFCKSPLIQIPCPVIQGNLIIEVRTALGHGLSNLERLYSIIWPLIDWWALSFLWAEVEVKFHFEAEPREPQNLTWYLELASKRIQISSSLAQKQPVAQPKPLLSHRDSNLNIPGQRVRCGPLDQPSRTTKNLVILQGWLSSARWSHDVSVYLRRMNAST
jgi:hypothetical protein